MAFSDYLRDPPFEPEDYPVLAAVALLPWAFGGVEIWAYRSASLLLVVGACIVLWRDGFEGLGLRSRRSLWLVPAFLLAAFAALQFSPLPAPVLRALSPHAHAIQAGVFDTAGLDPLTAIEQDALSRVPEASGALMPQDNWFGFRRDLVDPIEPRWRISLYPAATRERFFQFSALLLGFLVVRRRAADRETRHGYAAVLLASLGAMAAFGLLQWQTWNGKLFWVREAPVAEVNPFGPYLNPAHFAGTMEIAVPWLVGYTIWFAREAVRTRKTAGPVIAGSAALLCLGAVAAAASKAGALLAVIGAAVVLAAGPRSWKARGIAIAALVLVAAVGVLGLSTTQLGDRFERYETDVAQLGWLAERQVAWGAVLEMIGDYPIVGSGLGAFFEVFPRYLPTGANKSWDQAHNDYLEVLAGGGAVGGVLLLWLTAGFFLKLGGRVARFLRNGATPELGLAVGVLCLCAHAFVDFNHQIPGNSLLFVACCGLLVPFRPSSAAPGD